MCVQYLLQTSIKKVEKIFDTFSSQEMEWGAHFFPRSTAPVMIERKNERVLGPMSFGLIAPWETNPIPKQVFHNARSETVHLKPTFRDSFKNRRCIVPITHFIEWVGIPGKKKTIQFFCKANPLLGVAGIWNRWVSPVGQITYSYSLITKNPDPRILEQGHDRMPVILKPENYNEWLQPNSQNRLHEIIADSPNLFWESSDFNKDDYSKSPLMSLGLERKGRDEGPNAKTSSSLDA
ncbi:MAG: hypothetical protein CL678_07355 [Bdellovibrionaceae bacterium]|nr:hypothetical protein [Pseudobdellovibrionaceae bacterium]